MRNAPLHLINTPAIELWPGGLLRARSNADARVLARATHVLRRKADGQYLAAQLPHGLMPLVPHLPDEPGLAIALDALDAHRHPARRTRPSQDTLPLGSLAGYHAQLSLDTKEYADQSGLVLTPEPAVLTLAGRDRYRRPLWLTASAARAWQRLQAAASADGVPLEAISGYRSHAYQWGIFQRKLARGLTPRQILTVNAAPGFSEHHGGCALDISTPGEPAAEESFEHTAAFAWLRDHASRFGFYLSYPRNNPHGIVYEPWHWCWRPPSR